jgi:desulfoferrodoxin (superoxide reductase-like protein)
MKKVVLFIAILFIASNLLAHSPKKVELKYSKTEKELTVNAMHKVKDVKKHYISYILIKLNGEEIKKLEYTQQTSKKAFTVKIPIDAKVDDTIEVTAKCSKLGKKTGTLKIN